MRATIKEVIKYNESLIVKQEIQQTTTEVVNLMDIFGRKFTDIFLDSHNYIPPLRPLVKYRKYPRKK